MNHRPSKRDSSRKRTVLARAGTANSKKCQPGARPTPSTKLQVRDVAHLLFARYCAASGDCVPDKDRFRTIVVIDAEQDNRREPGKIAQ